VADRVAAGFAQQRNQYQYADRPLPEPVLGYFPGAAITRNVYGALVLNADEMMFVDIDLSAAPGRGHAVDPVLERIRGVVERAGLSARVYRTAAGHRAIITNRRFQAGSPEAEDLLYG